MFSSVSHSSGLGGSPSFNAVPSNDVTSLLSWYNVSGLESADPDIGSLPVLQLFPCISCSEGDRSRSNFVPIFSSPVRIFIEGVVSERLLIMSCVCCAFPKLDVSTRCWIPLGTTCFLSSFRSRRESLSACPACEESEVMDRK